MAANTPLPSPPSHLSSSRLSPPFHTYTSQGHHSNPRHTIIIVPFLLTSRAHTTIYNYTTTRHSRATIQHTSPHSPPHLNTLQLVFSSGCRASSIFLHFKAQFLVVLGVFPYFLLMCSKYNYEYLKNRHTVLTPRLLLTPAKIREQKYYYNIYDCLWYYKKIQKSVHRLFLKVFPTSTPTCSRQQYQ